MSGKPDSRTLATLIRSELESLGWTMYVDVGDDFLNALFHGTLKTFVERVDSSGFSHTSYGEENGIKCYGHVHYPRDADSVARVLASCGFVEKAIRICDFTLRNVPTGQYYLPHVYQPDGSVKANTVQVDTPAHTVMALARCVELAGPNEHLRSLFARLQTVLDGIWQHHFHADWNLLDAGNYNEQLDDNELTCDLFTNCAMAAGMNRFARLAMTFNEADTARIFQERAALLGAGIENNLFDPAQSIYLMQRDRASGKPGEGFKWINLYCERWYPGRAQAWEGALAKLQRDTLLDWDGHKIISGYPACDQILGKAFGHLLGYFAKTGRFTHLSRYLDFARATIRRPSHVYPEGWLYSWPAEPGEYLRGFMQRFGNTWQPYTRNPDGDYTLDSGNAEQCAAFMEHFIQDLLGVKVVDGSVHVWPKLPFEYERVVVQRVPLFRLGHDVAEVGYALDRREGKLDIIIERNMPFETRLTVALPADAVNVRIELDGRATAAESTPSHDVQWLTLDLPSQGALRAAARCVYERGHGTSASMRRAIAPANG